MEYSRRYELTINNAINLEDVRRVFDMEVYAKVIISGDKKQQRRTPVDKHGHTNPAWHHTLKYVIDESGIPHHGSVVKIKLYCKRLLGDRYIGEVNKSLRELCDQAYRAGGNGNGAFCSPVQKGMAVSQGQLYVSYNFGDREPLEHLRVHTILQTMYSLMLIFQLDTDCPFYVLDRLLSDEYEISNVLLLSFLLAICTARIIFTYLV